MLLTVVLLAIAGVIKQIQIHSLKLRVDQLERRMNG